MNYKELATKIKALTSKADLIDSAETILDLPNKYVEDWSNFIGKTLNIGTLVLYNEVKYLVKQTVVPI